MAQELRDIRWAILVRLAGAAAASEASKCRAVSFSSSEDVASRADDRASHGYNRQPRSTTRLPPHRTGGRVPP